MKNNISVHEEKKLTLVDYGRANKICFRLNGPKVCKKLTFNVLKGALA